MQKAMEENGNGRGRESESEKEEEEEEEAALERGGTGTDREKEEDSMGMLQCRAGEANYGMKAAGSGAVRCEDNFDGNIIT